MTISTDIIKKIYSRLTTETKLSFVSAFLIGIITHLSIITNRLTNWDDIAVTPYAGGGKFFGRWFMEYVFPLFDKWGSETLNGVMAILFLALTVSVIINVLNIRSYTGIILTAALIMTFPSIISCMAFVYMSPTFFVATFLAALSVKLTIKEKRFFVPGIVLLVLSMAIYQAYFALATSLFIMILITHLINGREIKELFTEGIKYLAMLICTMIFYFLSIKLTGVELTSYRGMNNLGELGVTSYLIAVARAYHRLLEYFVTSQPSYVYGFLSVMFYLMMVLLIISIVLSFVKMKKGDAAHKASYLLLLIIFPLAVSLVYVMAPEESQASTIMTFAYVLVLVYPIMIAENLNLRLDAGKNINIIYTGLTLCGTLIILLTSYGQYRMTNKAYYRTEVALERVSQFYDRLIMRLELTEGYEYGDQVAILGDFYPEDLPVSSYAMEKDYWEDLEGIAVEEGLFTEGIRSYYIRTHIGIDTGVYDEDILSSIKATDEYVQMPCYPSDGCIAKIDNVWVIKVAK